MKRLRHWKQQFDPNAKFIWQKAILWAGTEVKPGTEIPKELFDNKNKLRRFWEAKAIELFEFEPPKIVYTGLGDEKEVQPVDPETLVKKLGDRKWVVLTEPDVFYKSKALAIEAIGASMDAPTDKPAETDKAPVKTDEAPVETDKAPVE